MRNISHSVLKMTEEIQLAAAVHSFLFYSFRTTFKNEQRVFSLACFVCILVGFLLSRKISNFHWRSRTVF